jgi:hypothetical protein
MFLVLTNEDCARLRPDVLREILAQVGLTSASATCAAPSVPKGAEAMNFAGIVDLTSEQVYEFMSGLGKRRPGMACACSPNTARSRGEASRYPEQQLQPLPD